MKKSLISLVAVVVIGIVFLGYRFHLYERIFNPKKFFFVTVKGTDFYLHGEPFRFIGANTRLIHGRKERGMVTEALQHAKANGIRLLRQWAIGDDSTAKHHPISQYYFQAGPNNWVEPSFAHFDSLLAEASKNDIKVMVTLVNNWSDFGGMPMYLEWAGYTDDARNYAVHDSFYTDPQIDTWLKGFADKLIMRRNTVTGRLYRDDPTVFSWELVNEARANLDKYDAMVQWTNRMAEYLKKLDPNHLVGISLVMVDNRIERQHIENVFSLGALDYVDMHMYPAEHWWKNFIVDQNALQQLVDDFVQIAHYVVKKPVIIGEVGFKQGASRLGETRERIFQTLFDHSYRNGVSGVVVWSYSDPAWDDIYVINWRQPEHAQLCSLLTVYGVKFAKNTEPLADNPNIGPQLGDLLRVQIREHTFATDTVLAQSAATDEIVYEIPVRSFAKAKWTNFDFRDNNQGYAFLFGKDQGYFEYPFFAEKPASINAVSIRARLSTDLPPIADPDTLGLSEITVSINDIELATLAVRPQEYFGSVYEINLTRDDGRPLFDLSAGQNTLKFTVKNQAVHRNGLIILSEVVSDKSKISQTPIRLAFRRKPQQQAN